MTNLAEAIETSLRGAWCKLALRPPMIELDGQPMGPAFSILIYRHQPGAGEQEPGVLHVCRPSTELPLRPIELRLLECGSWRLSNAGESDVRLSTAKELIGVVQPGKTLDVLAPAFRVRVRTLFFDFRLQPAEPPKLESLKIERLAEFQADSSMVSYPLHIGKWPCQLLSATDFWTGIEAVRERLLIDTWQRFAHEIQAHALPEVRCGIQADLPPGPSLIAYRVQICVEGKASTLIFVAPSTLAVLIRQAVQGAAELACQWTYLVVAGGQNLPLASLRRLRTGSVVVLSETPVLHEVSTGRSWLLAEPGGEDRRYSVGKEVSGFLELEAPRMAVPRTHDPSTPAPVSIDSIEVRIQAVVSSERVPFSELGRYLPGQHLPIEFGPGKSVDIYINGRKLGAGKLVSLNLPPGEGRPPKLGLQVVSWDA